jgi:hypothetical protein
MKILMKNPENDDTYRMYPVMSGACVPAPDIGEARYGQNLLHPSPR